MKTILIACIALLAGGCTDSAPLPEPVTDQTQLTSTNASVSTDAQSPVPPPNTKLPPNFPQPNPPCTSGPFGPITQPVSPQ